MAKLDRSALARLDDCMARWVARGDYAGIEWMIGDATGAVLHQGRAGAREIGGAAMPDTPIYRIYSMTKPILSIAAMQMVEECRLRLHLPIADWLPEYADMQVLGADGSRRPARAPIRVQHLLCHMSGLYYGFAGEPLEDETAGDCLLATTTPLREAVRDFARFPLDFDPGTRWRYSCASDVLGAIMEIIEQKPLPEILRARVLAPLGMTETGFRVPAAAQARVMGMHGGRQPEDPTTVPLDVNAPYPLDDPDFARGGHGLYATMQDYARFTAALLALARGGDRAPGLVGRKTLAAMTENHVPDSALPLHIELIDLDQRPGLGGYGFGLGFRRALGKRDRRILASEGEFGWSGAAETWFSVDPHEGVHALFMTQNLDFSGASEDFQTMLNAALT